MWLNHSLTMRPTNQPAAQAAPTRPTSGAPPNPLDYSIKPVEHHPTRSTTNPIDPLSKYPTRLTAWSNQPDRLVEHHPTRSTTRSNLLSTTLPARRLKPPRQHEIFLEVYFRCGIMCQYWRTLCMSSCIRSFTCAQQAENCLTRWFIGRFETRNNIYHKQCEHWCRRLIIFVLRC